jgi:hypothetical protein
MGITHPSCENVWVYILPQLDFTAGNSVLCDVQTDAKEMDDGQNVTVEHE